MNMQNTPSLGHLSRNAPQAQGKAEAQFVEWFKHARAGHRCVVFRDLTYNAKQGGLQTIEIRFHLPQQEAGGEKQEEGNPKTDAVQFEYVTVFRWFNEYDYDVETNWEFDEHGELCSYSQAHFVPPHNPSSRERQSAMAVLRNLYETWRAFRDAYRVEYPEDANDHE